MVTFPLVHGAGTGGWLWDDVAVTSGLKEVCSPWPTACSPGLDGAPACDRPFRDGHHATSPDSVVFIGAHSQQRRRTRSGDLRNPRARRPSFARPRATAGRLGTALAVSGQILFMVPGTISTFATPAIGTAYLSGNREVMALEFSPVLTAIIGVALLLAVSGNTILGLAIWRSGVLPKWAGVMWIAAVTSTSSGPSSAWPPPAPACPPSLSAQFS